MCFAVSRVSAVHRKDASKHHRFVRGAETIAAVPAHGSCGLMWRWNHYHMTPFFANEGWQHWCLSIIHGFFACWAELIPIFQPSQQRGQKGRASGHDKAYEVLFFRLDL